MDNRTYRAALKRVDEALAEAEERESRVKDLTTALQMIADRARSGYGVKALLGIADRALAGEPAAQPHESSLMGAVARAGKEAKGG